MTTIEIKFDGLGISYHSGESSLSTSSSSSSSTTTNREIAPSILNKRYGMEKISMDGRGIVNVDVTSYDDAID